MGGRRVGLKILLFGVSLVAGWWFATATPDYLQVGPAVDLGGVADSILAVEASS
jgi:hypothetical protein